MESDVRRPWLFPRSPALRALSLYMFAPALAAAAFVYAGIPILATIAPGIVIPVDDPGSDDRPPIIVSSGSLNFEGGDTENIGKGMQKWMNAAVTGASNAWKPDHDKGADVTGFTVYVAGFDPAQCSVSTLPGSLIEIDYTLDQGGTTEKFYVKRLQLTGKKFEPVLVPPADVTLNDTSTAAMSRITAKDAGHISSVSVDGGTPCGFADPGADPVKRRAVRITIVAER